MKNISTKLAIVAIAGSVSMLTFAEHHMGDGHADMDKQQPSFSAMDKDGDGAISEMEAQASPKLTEQWDSVDSDSDQAISESEFSKFEMKEMSDEPSMDNAMDEGMEGGMDTGREGQADPDRLGSEAKTMNGEPDPVQE